MNNDELKKFARKWLEFANSDLILSQQVTKGVLRNPLCFHAQQAVEKSLNDITNHI